MIGRRMVTAALALALVQSLAPGAAMSGPRGATDGPTVFRPQPATNNGDYAVGPTTRFPGVKAPDGADMYVELTLPAKGPKGIEPKEPFPVILYMTPYEGSWNRTPLSTIWFAVRDNYVSRGYAFALGHVYGTGNSDGCFEQFGPNEVAATSAVIEALGSAGWSNGRVGVYGTRYEGASGLYAAALGSKEAREHLAAVVAVDGATSRGEIWGRDGVAGSGTATFVTGEYSALAQPPDLLSGVTALDDPEGAVRRQASVCLADNMAAAARYESTGDFSNWLAQRSVLAAAPKVHAAILMMEGFHDGTDGTAGANAPIGFFDRLPEDVPHKLVLGQWGHAQVQSYRADRSAMAVAWLDRFLLDHPTGVEDWPEVQVQDSAGRWRVEGTWPSTGGPLGQLALTEGGGLGTPSPSGSTTYLEVGASDGMPVTPPTNATFSTGPLAGPLHLAGLPILDLWVQLEEPDAHIAVEFHAEDEKGNAITGTGYVDGTAGSERFQIAAYRSAQHLDPIMNGEFRQMHGRPAPTGTPLRVPVRFALPLDLVVPEGGRVTIEIAGTNTVPLSPSMPSGSNGEVTILHDCAHPSALRFVMPDAEPEWLDVQMKPVEQPQLFRVDVPPGLRDGGGLASSKVCGKQPLDPQKVVEQP